MRKCSTKCLIDTTLIDFEGYFSLNVAVFLGKFKCITQLRIGAVVKNTVHQEHN